MGVLISQSIITAWKHKVLAVSFIIIWSPLYDNEIQKELEIEEKLPGSAGILFLVRERSSSIFHTLPPRFNLWLFASRTRDNACRTLAGAAVLNFELVVFTLHFCHEYYQHSSAFTGRLLDNSSVQFVSKQKAHEFKSPISERCSCEIGRSQNIKEKKTRQRDQ